MIQGQEKIIAEIIEMHGKVFGTGAPPTLSPELQYIVDKHPEWVGKRQEPDMFFVFPANAEGESDVHSPYSRWVSDPKDLPDFNDPTLWSGNNVPDYVASGQGRMVTIGLTTDRSTWEVSGQVLTDNNQIKYFDSSEI